MLRKLLINLALTTSLIILITPVKAAASNGLVSLSPPLKVLSLPPGLLQATITITLTNGTIYDLAVTATAKDFTPLSNGTIALGQYQPADSNYGLAKWLELPNGKSLTLKAGQKATVTVLVDNQPDLGPGGHYGAIVFSTSALTSAGTKPVAFNQQLTSLFFVRKVGGDIAKLSLDSLKTKKGSGLPDTATTVFASTGNVYVVPRGYLQITDAHGHLVAKGQLNPESTLIPQGTSRSFETILQPVENMRPSGRLKLTVYYRVEGQSAFQSRSIYLENPLISRGKLLFLLIGVAAGAGLLFVLFARRHRHHFSVRR